MTTGSTAEGLLIHEVVEQFGLQTSGTNLADESKVKERFKIDHPNAVGVEDKVNGNKRDTKQEALDRFNGPFSSTYTKYFIERNGTYTMESYTKNTTEMKVTKQLNVQ